MIMTEEKREKRTPEKQGRIVSKHGISQASAWPKQTSSRGERRRGQIHNISASKERRLLLFTSRFSRMFEKLFISVSKQLRSWVLFGGYGRADGHAFGVLAFFRKSEKNTRYFFYCDFWRFIANNSTNSCNFCEWCYFLRARHTLISYSYSYLFSFFFTLFRDSSIKSLIA